MAGSESPGGGLRFVVYGETTILDADGNPIGRLRPGNTYVAIEVTNDYLVIKSPTKGRAFVELDMVEVMDSASDPEHPVAPPTQPAGSVASVAGRPPPAVPSSASAAMQDRPLWRHPGVIGGIVAAVVAAVVLGVVLTGGGESDPIVADPGVAEPAADQDASGPDDANESAGEATAGDTAQGSEQPDEPETEAGEAGESEPVGDLGPERPGPAVIVGSGVSTADGTLANRSFTQTAFGSLNNAADFNPALGPTEPPTIVWRTDDPLASNPVVVPGALIAGFSDRTIRALGSRTGEEIWRTELEIFRANDVWIAGDTVVATQGPDFSLFDLATGEPVGVIERPEGIEGLAHEATLVAGVLVASWTESAPGDVIATVAAFDAASGENLWQRETRGENFPAPMTFAAGVIVYAHADSINGFELLTGEQRWAHTVDRFLPLVVAVEGPMVVFRDSVLRSLDARTGELSWSSSDGSGVHFGIDRGRIVVPNTDLGVTDIATGARRSAGRVEDGLFGRGISAVSRGVGYVQLSDGALVAIDLETATQLWTTSILSGEFAPLAPMQIGDGLLFILEEDRQLIAVG